MCKLIDYIANYVQTKLFFRLNICPIYMPKLILVYFKFLNIFIHGRAPFFCVRCSLYLPLLVIRVRVRSACENANNSTDGPPTTQSPSHPHQQAKTYASVGQNRYFPRKTHKRRADSEEGPFKKLWQKG